ncbi:hypothetical protein [Streptomyces sp. NPDC093600]|uniref:hypothetical protein n=1 Tax=Streptomyces sp. NPDC093600 TaxID=3366047 RepID=UPI003830E26B
MAPRRHAPPRPAAGYKAARTEAEQHGVAGGETGLAEQLLTGLDLRATTLTVKIAALVRAAGTDRDVPDRAEALRAEITTADLRASEAMLELALAFHRTATGNSPAAAANITRLRDLFPDGDYAYCAEVAWSEAWMRQWSSSAGRP